MKTLILQKQKLIHLLKLSAVSQLLLLSAAPAPCESLTKYNMCSIDHLRIAKVIERYETVQVPPLPHEALAMSEQAFVYKTKYKISNEVFVGDKFTVYENKEKGNIDLSHYSVQYLNLEFVPPKTEIEGKLEVDKKYVFFIAKDGSRESFKISRVEPVNNTDKLLKLFKERECK